MELVEIALWIIGILAFFVVTTFLLKKFAKAQTFYIGSMVKTTRFLPLLDKISKHEKILNAFADIGLVLGFGAIAIDFLVGKKLRLIPRILLFIASTAILFVLFNLSFSVLLSNPFIEQYNFFMSLGFGVMGFAGFMVVMLAAYSEFVITSALAGQKSCPGVAPLLPGVSLPNFPVTVPLHGWISLLIILLVHEGMHGALARKARIKIKSAGLLLLGILPIGAFVEPDEEQLKHTNERDQLRVFSAGPTANLFCAVITGLFVFFVFPSIITFSFLEYNNNIGSVAISSVDQNINLCGRITPSPAFGKLEAGMIVKEINGIKVESANGWSAKIKEIGKNPYQLTVQKDENSAAETIAITPDEMGYQGYSVEDKLKTGAKFSQAYVYFIFAISFIYSFLFWFFLLNFLVAIANFLPLEPFDGGKIAKALIVPYLGFWKASKEEKEKTLSKIFFWFVLALLILNAVPFFI
ncbi:MAG: site-2 protease family protein [Candidatus ainarchaeum sp.]|nr:site-2 protease family protein [Candidatus ainarchaeum sp.]